MFALTKCLFLRIIPLLLCCGVACTSTVVNAATSTSPTTPATSTSAESNYARQENEFAGAIVIDTASKKVLYEYQADELHPAASLTKIANAITFAKLQPNWNKTVTLSSVDEVGGGRLRVNSGTKISIKDLFFSSITASANNAATALARVSPLGSSSAFIKRMNKEAQNAGATHSTFVDASGMNPKNMTTARDMAKLMQAAMKIPQFNKAASSKEYPVVVTQPKKSTQTRVIHNTNDLLIKPQHDDVWVTAGKTGYLPEAQYNLAVQVSPFDVKSQQPEREKKLLIIVLGSPSKVGSFASAKRLAEWAWNSHEFAQSTSLSRR